MKQHLAICIDGKYLELPCDFSIDHEDVNPYFNEKESFSYPVEAPIDGNRVLFQNVDDINSAMRMVDLEHLPMQLMVDGVPFRSGRLQVEDEAELMGSVGFSMVSAIKTLSEMVADLNCTDIPVKDKIQIGEMIGNVLFDAGFDYKMESKSSGKTGFLSWSSSKSVGQSHSEQITHKFELQALGFSFPGICQEKSGTAFEATQQGGKPVIAQSFINTSDAYPQAKYCNARVCYTHYKKNQDGSTSDTVSTTEEYDPFLVLEADRPQSGVCFYVLYFLDCLFHSLGLSYDNSQLLSVGDMKRLAFFTTHCKFDLERKTTNTGYDLANETQINKWLSSRKTLGSLSCRYDQTKDIDTIVYNGQLYKVGDKLPNGETLKSNCFKVTNVSMAVKANIMKMYANADNFPSAGVSQILDSLWASMGIKFIMDHETQSVKAVYIRELYRNNEPPIALQGSVISVVPVSEKITGVRMQYSQESSAKDKLEQVRTGQKDYDTDYDYTDYRKVDATKTYVDIVQKQSSSDTTCYIDKTTGNAYRLKVNSDAEKASELKPALFEVGGFKGVDVGDCSTMNDDFVEELVSDFQPIAFTDVNGRNLKALGTGKTTTMVSDDTGETATISTVNSDSMKQVLAVFVDEEMHHENVEMRIDNAIGTDHADFYVTEVFNTREAYDATGTDDGNSPLQHYDWGNAVAIMRGGGADATVQSYDYNYDGFGNSKWRTVSGQYAMTSDSLDNFGSEFDYNGVEPGVGTEERFSLKVRAFKEVDGEIMCNDDVRDAQGNITTKVRSRGLFDTFMAEHAHFLLHRKKYRITVQCQVSELIDIPNNWHRRFTIGGITGWINKVRTSVSVAGGLDLVEIEMYSL